MSHIVKQVGAVKLQDLELLRRACSAVREELLGTTLKLDINKKEARFWRGNLEPADAVITFNRDLTADEQNRYYEIALKRNTATNQYEMFADVSAGDHGAYKRIERLQAAYHIECQKEQGIADGYIVAGQREVSPGKFELVLEKA